MSDNQRTSAQRQADEDAQWEAIKGRRNRVGQALEGDAWVNGHDYDSYEDTLLRVAALLPQDNDLILRQDGDRWMCVKGDFEDLQTSESWWGDTPEQALIEYTTR